MSVRYLTEIQGANGSASVAHVGDVKLVAVTSMRTDWIPLRHESQDYGEPGPVALFASRELARESALEAVWNGQRFRVRAARGRARASGREVGTDKRKEGDS